MQNRILKFRIWDTTNKNMVYDNLYTQDYSKEKNSEYDKVFIALDGNIPRDVSSRYELMQYIGLEDALGVKIFEGDIVENVNFIGVTVFKNGAFCLEEKVAKIPMFCSDFNTFSHRIMGAPIWDKVIGNICENSELLKNNEN